MADVVVAAMDAPPVGAGVPTGGVAAAGAGSTARAVAGAAVWVGAEPFGGGSGRAVGALAGAGSADATRARVGDINQSGDETTIAALMICGRLSRGRRILTFMAHMAKQASYRALRVETTLLRS